MVDWDCPRQPDPGAYPTQTTVQASRLRSSTLSSAFAHPPCLSPSLIHPVFRLGLCVDSQGIFPSNYIKVSREAVPASPGAAGKAALAEKIQFKGFLSKKSGGKAVGGREIGWQQRWFVLDNGVLSYFKGQNAEAMFAQLDADLSGYLDHEEVAELCKQLGKKVRICPAYVPC